MRLASPPWNTLRKNTSSQTPVSREMTANCQIVHGSKTVRTRASRNSLIRSSAGSEKCSSQEDCGPAAFGRSEVARCFRYCSTLGDMMLLRSRRLSCDPQAPTRSALPELTVRFGSNDSGTPIRAANSSRPTASADAPRSSHSHPPQRQFVAESSICVFFTRILTAVRIGVSGPFAG